MLNGDLLLIWFLAATRATGLLMMVPIFSSRTVPVPIRLLLGFFLAFTVASLRRPPGALPSTVGMLVAAVALELVVGLFMGWAVRLAVQTIEIAGHIVSTEMGLQTGQQMDPTSGTSTTAIGAVMLAFSSLVFLISGAHQPLIAAYLRSYEVAPLGMFHGNEDVGVMLVGATSKVFQVALQMSAPLISVNFIISLTFSILGKAAPGIQVFSESFAVRILVGMILLGVTFGLAAQLLLDQYRGIPALMLRLIP